MMNTSTRLRQLADRMGLDGFAEELREIAGELEAPAEPFGHFRAEPFGWTDCAADDEGAIALYERPAAPAVPEIDYEALIHAAFAKNAKWAQGTAGCIAFARGAEWFRDQMLAAPSQTAVPQGDTVEIIGMRGGKEHHLGTMRMPPRMKAREIAREQFGHFVDDDGSDAELCFGALEQLIDYMQATPAAPSQPVTLTDFDAIPDEVIDTAQDKSGMYRVELMRAWDAIIAALREKEQTK